MSSFEHDSQTLIPVAPIILQRSAPDSLVISSVEPCQLSTDCSHHLWLPVGLASMCLLTFAWL